MPSEDTQDKTESKKPAAAKAKPVKRATLDDLRSKKRQEKEIPFVLNGEEVSFLFRAISARDYDRLVTANPPNVEQRVAGSTFNINTFAPALLSRVVIDPSLSEDDWGDLWTSPDWNRGELMTLFGEAVEICSTGLRLGPTATA